MTRKHRIVLLVTLITTLVLACVGIAWAQGSAGTSAAADSASTAASASAASTSATSDSTSSSSSASDSFVIYYTNDVHGNAETNIGYAKLKTLVDQDDAMLVDAGDSLNGVAFATVDQGASVAQILQAMNYDVLVPGNHDFDFGYQTLLDYASEDNLPYISCNVTYAADGSSLFEGTKIIERDGIKVGFFGVTTPETALKTDPKHVEGLDFGTDEQVFADAQACVDELKSEGADVIIAVTHLGSESSYNPSSEELAENVEGIDLIIDGHSHSVVPDLIVDGTDITSTGTALENIGKATIQVADGHVWVSTELLDADAVADVEPDATIAGLIADIDDQQSVVLDQVVMNSTYDLDGEREDVRYWSTNLGRVICASMMDASGADMAIINSGSIRASIAAGDVTYGDLISVLPFGNYVVKIKATGQNIIDALNASMVPGEGEFPQFYGIDIVVEETSVAADDGTEYPAYTILSATLPDGTAIDPAATYTVAINDYMYAGGDSYAGLSSCELVEETEPLSQALIDYMGTADISTVVNDNATMVGQGVSNGSSASGSAAVASGTASGSTAASGSAAVASGAASGTTAAASSATSGTTAAAA